jgi:hypothetical protein
VRSSKCASTTVNFDTCALLPRALYLSPRLAPISPLATLVCGVLSACFRRARSCAAACLEQHHHDIITLRPGQAGQRASLSERGPERAERDSGGAGERAGNTGQARRGVAGVQSGRAGWADEWNGARRAVEPVRARAERGRARVAWRGGAGERARARRARRSGARRVARRGGAGERTERRGAGGRA